MKTIERLVLCSILVLALVVPAQAAEPPALVNYQGVLRNADYTPRHGDHDMVFTFFGAESGGDEILVDRHLAADGNAVTVSSGLFNVPLGGGVLSDGAGPGAYASLADAFRDYGEVWVGIEVQGETLAPRVQVVSAGYALNADSLDGRDGAFFLDTSATAQEKAGLLVATGGVDFGPGADDDLTALDVDMLTSGVSADGLHTHGSVGGSDSLDGLDSEQFLRSDASDTFTTGALTMGEGTTLNVTGQLWANGLVHVDHYGPDSDQYLFFWDGDAPGGQALFWDDSDDRFVLTSGLRTPGVFDRDDPTYFVDPAGVSVFDGLQLNSNDLFLNQDGPDGNSRIFFHDSGLPNDEWFGWNDAGDRFELSDDLYGAHDVTAQRFVDAGSSSYLLDPASISTLNTLHLDSTYLYLNHDGPELSAGIRFFDKGSPSGEQFQWNEASDRFELSDELSVVGQVLADRLQDRNNTTYYLDPSSTSILNTVQLSGQYTYFNQDGPDGQVSLFFWDDGSSTNESIQWDDVNDLFEFSNDVTVNGDLSLAGTGFTGNLAIDGELEIGRATEDDQIVFDGAESLTWDNSETRFEFSDEVIVGLLTVGPTNTPPVSYNRIGGGTATPLAATDVTNSSDLLVSGDLEVADRLYVDGTIVVGEDNPTANQLFSSFGDANLKDEGSINDDNDVYIQGDLEVDFNIYTSWVLGSTLNFLADANQFARIDDDDNSALSEYRWFHDGTTSAADQLAEIQEDGDLRIRGTLTQSVSFDVAESFIAGEPLEPGELVRIDPARPDGVLKTTGVADAGVLGVISSDPGMVLGAAPFDSETLRRVWGDAVHADFLGTLEALKTELVAAYPELQRERDELGTLQMRVEQERAALAAMSGRQSVSQTRASSPAGDVGEVLAAPPNALDEHGEALEQLERELEDGRMRLEEDLRSLALERFFERKFVPVALAGRVPVKIDASFGAVRPGDLLSPSPEPGVAMKADGTRPVIGTALEAFDAGSGRILVLVTPGHFTPADQIASIEQEQGALADRIDARTPDPDTGVQSMQGHLQVVLDRNADDRARFSIFRDGGDGLGDEVFRVDEDGNVFAKGAFSPASMDVAEFFPMLEPFEAGHVLVASRENEGSCELARQTSDAAVVGVVAKEPGVLLGRSLERIALADPALAERLELARRVGDTKAEARLWTGMEREFLKTHAAVAMSGTVEVRADAGYGAIRVGDLLTSSPTPGHAMRSDEVLPGTILGKALTSLDAGTGSVSMLVMPR